MGKYMRKAKLCGEVAVMEVPHQTPLGVRTRARTLALQRLLKPSSSPSPSPSLSPSSSPEYLELRSRRLEKPPPPPPREACERRRGGGGKPAAPARRRVASAAAGEEAPDAGAEASSLGENAPEADSRDRNVRETTPCSLVRDSETVSTPGSTTRTNSTAANRRVRSSVRRDIPTTHEMEEFFSAAERIQQQMFSERYNFDPVNERPLPGRYEWVKLGY